MDLKLQTSPAYDYPEFEGMYSTGQFRGVVSSVEYAKTHFNKEAPTLKYKGTIKLDGTNGTLSANLSTGDVYVLSKEQYLVEGVDNNGFRAHVEANKAVFLNVVAQAVALAQEWAAKASIAYTDVQLYGEWCGGSIVKKVALNKLPRKFVIFGVKLLNRNVSSEDNMRGIVPPYLVSKLKDDSGVILNIHDFPCKFIELSFFDEQRLAAAVNQMTEWTEEATATCPFAKTFGVEGVGEGWVWSVDFDEEALEDVSLHPYVSTRYLFKTKGKRHAVTNTKTLIEVNAQEVEDLNNFVDMVLADARVDQGVRVVSAQLGLEESTVSIEHMGTIIAWLVKDVMKEERDRLPPNFDERKLKSLLSKKAAQLLKLKLN